MGLIKILPWIILAVIVLFFFSRQKQKREREAMEEELKSMRRRLAERNREGSVESSEMVRCPHCGTYFPKNEGVVKNGRLYCSRDCARRG
ncbi:MAG: hypothetical protein MR009_02505 [Sutterellaceae bacterium]|nr:hypothetical protein [Sutterellaceae bacterium]MDD7441137.1 PP0621 family protein [Sutterellaceae bacterium]MDY2867468.1 PP0621 family protein [Mesosutterella sp.]